MRPSERRSMIRKENTDLSLTRQCMLLKIGRLSLYYTPVGFDEATIDPMHEIDRIFAKYPFFAVTRLQRIYLIRVSRRVATVSVA
jgi:putative transposase